MGLEVDDSNSKMGPAKSLRSLMQLEHVPAAQYRSTLSIEPSVSRWAVQL